MPTRRSWPAALIALAGCARLVGLDELSDEPAATEPGGAERAAPSAVDGSTSGDTGAERDSAGDPAGSGAGDRSPVDDPLAPDRQSELGGVVGAPVEASDAGAVQAGSSRCSIDAPCEGTDPCLTSACQSGACVVVGPATAGTSCGSAVDDACTNPDSCDGQGSCQRNDEPLGADCQGGTCNGGLCIASQPSGCVVDAVARVPFTANWSSVNRPDLYDGGCDTEGTPDYALVFTAPQAAVYRIASAALVDAVPYTGPVPDGPLDGDAVMTIARGDCAGGDAQQLACNDDVQVGTLNSQVDLELFAGEVVTVYLNELGQTGGGTGTVIIEALP